MSTNPLRVISYVDGFNLYYGLRDSAMKGLYWLNIEALVESVLRKNQTLVAVKYFTARISGSSPGMPKTVGSKMEAKRRRQATFLEALGTLGRTRIIEGHFLSCTSPSHAPSASLAGRSLKRK